MKNVVLKKKSMRNVRRRNFKSGDVWYDPLIQEFYLILKKYKTELRIKWLHKDLTQTVKSEHCSEDSFIRTISSLERELL